MGRMAGCCSRASALASWRDRKSTRLNSSHLVISYAVFCLKKKKNQAKDEGGAARAGAKEAVQTPRGGDGAGKPGFRYPRLGEDRACQNSHRGQKKRSGSRH